MVGWGVVALCALYCWRLLSLRTAARAAYAKTEKIKASRIFVGWTPETAHNASSANMPPMFPHEAWAVKKIWTKMSRES